MSTCQSQTCLKSSVDFPQSWIIWEAMASATSIAFFKDDIHYYYFSTQLFNRTHTCKHTHFCHSDHINCGVEEWGAEEIKWRICDVARERKGDTVCVRV